MRRDEATVTTYIHMNDRDNVRISVDYGHTVAGNYRVINLGERATLFVSPEQLRELRDKINDHLGETSSKLPTPEDTVDHSPSAGMFAAACEDTLRATMNPEPPVEAMPDTDLEPVKLFTDDGIPF